MALIKRGEPFDVEYRIQRRDGDWIWIHDRATRSYEVEGTLRVDGVFLDITERKKAENALQESEARYRELFDHMSSGVAVYEAVDDGNDFIFKDFNKSGQRIDNMGKEEFMGKRVTEVFPGVKDFGLFEVFVRVWKTGQPEHYPVTLYKDERVSGWRENYVYRLASGEIVAVYDDITERKQAEKELQLFRKAVDSSSDAIGMSTPEGRHYYQNQAFTELFGLTTEETHGEEGPPSTIYADEKTGREVFETIMRGDSWTGEVEMVSKSGQKIDAFLRAYAIKDSQNKVIGLVGMFTDITEQKRAREEIENLSKFPSENPNPVLRISKAGEVLYNNETGKLLLGAWKSEVGKPVPKKWHNLITEAFTSEKGTKEEEEVEDRIFSIIVAPIKEAGYINLYAHEITERKQAEEKNYKYQQQLKSMVTELVRVEEQEQKRIADILHDSLAQTLVFLKIRIDLLAQETCSVLEAKTLKEISQSLKDLLEQTRDLSFELKSPILQTLGLGAAIQEWLTEKAGKKHGLEIRFEQDESSKPLPRKMEAMLFQMTRELLTNVVKHAQAHRVTVSLKHAGQGVELVVGDDGIGLDAEALKGPAGFGLFSIKERLTSVGGDLAIRSKPGQGTQMMLRVPLDENQNIMEDKG